MADIMKVLPPEEIKRLWLEGSTTGFHPNYAEIVAQAQRNLTNQQWIECVETFFGFEGDAMWLKDSAKNTFWKWQALKSAIKEKDAN